MKSFRLDVFGRQVLAVRTDDSWTMFYLGADGKRRPAGDLLVPPFVDELEIEGYLADLCHEWATEEHPGVRRLDSVRRVQGPSR